MGSIVVCGGSVIGLCTAMMLAQDGHQVTVFEADPAGVPATPGEAWQSWERKGVAQFRQPHNLFARFRHVCDEELPGMTKGLLAAGCVWVDYLKPLPPGISDREPRPGDETLRFVTGRRPVIESVIAAAAEEQAGLTIRRGVQVTELAGGRSAIPGIPHVAGVRTSAGEEHHADLVVDAMGRRSGSEHLLTTLGGRPPYSEAEDSGFAYYTRYFTGPSRPRLRGPALMPMGTINLLTLDGDNDTWSVTVFSSSGDAPLKALRHPDCFTRVVSACPLQAHWLDGQAITAVLPMAGILDRYRRFVVEGSPIVTGFAAVGDAWSCTNPSAGRGLSVGLVHAQLLRNTVQGYLGDPAAFAWAWDEGTERVVAPFYWNQIRADRARIAEMNALREGRDWSPDGSMWSGLATAAAYDADAFRALLETVLCLALPHEVFARPGMKDKIAQWADRAAPFPGPDRRQLMGLLAGAP
jgi:2-polyprenyl-6-methoxyphenol hydroxylase-like FAD-dependent oxidoreductase